MRGAARVSVVVGMAAALFLSGCGREDKGRAVAANAVAAVGNQVITAEAFQSELARRAQASPARYHDPKEKAALLDELIRAEVLYQKALAAGYDKDPQVATSLRRIITAKYQEDQLAKLGQPKITPQDITNYYQMNPQRFGTPEKLRVALIKLNAARTANSEKRADIRQTAERLLATAKAAPAADGSFGALAQQNSEDQASRYRGGDIGWLSAGDSTAPWPAPVMEAISKLTHDGDFAPVVETPTAFYLVRLSGRQPARVRPIEQVTDGVRYLVRREKENQQEQDLYTALKQGLTIRTNHALLESIRLPVQELRPPAVPGGATVQIPNGS